MDFNVYSLYLFHFHSYVFNNKQFVRIKCWTLDKLKFTYKNKEPFTTKCFQLCGYIFFYLLGISNVICVEWKRLFDYNPVDEAKIYNAIVYLLLYTYYSCYFLFIFCSFFTVSNKMLLCLNIII